MEFGFKEMSSAGGLVDLLFPATWHNRNRQQYCNYCNRLIAANYDAPLIFTRSENDRQHQTGWAKFSISCWHRQRLAECCTRVQKGVLPWRLPSWLLQVHAVIQSIILCVYRCGHCEHLFVIVSQMMATSLEECFAFEWLSCCMAMCLTQFWRWAIFQYKSFTSSVSKN